jgi:hypothetical protein
LEDVHPTNAQHLSQIAGRVSRGIGFFHLLEAEDERIDPLLRETDEVDRCRASWAIRDPIARRI